MSKPKKIATDAGAQVGGGFFQAFSGLGDLGPLPEGPVEKEAEEEKKGPLKKGRVVLRKETAHRGGKTVIVVDDFSDQISDDMIEALGRKLRTSCGCGGAIRGRSIELQGENVARIREILTNEGYRVAGIS